MDLLWNINKYTVRLIKQFFEQLFFLLSRREYTIAINRVNYSIIILCLNGKLVNSKTLESLNIIE